MTLLDGMIYIEWQEAVMSGISENTLKSVRFKDLDSFKFLDDPTDARKVLIHYDSLKPQYKSLIIQKFGEPKQYLANSTILAHLTPDPLARKCYTEFKLADGTGLPQKHIEQYTAAAQWLNLLGNDKVICKKLGLSKKEFYGAALSMIKEKKIDLPANYNRLKKKLKEYKTEGYPVLISKKFGNDNSEKLTEDGKQWLIAQYATPLKLNCDTAALTLKYKAEALQRGWQPVTEQCIYKFLHQHDVEVLWSLGRNGWKYWRGKFEHKNATVPASFRDALWQGDGTKLNFFTDGLRALLNMYVIADVHSEVFLGVDFTSETESVTVQRRALKRAVKFAGHKPYQIKYDNQGGHKTEEAQAFFSKLATVHFPTKAYNAESKRIESMLGRFQKQILSQYWFFTGMNVTAKSIESAPNLDFYNQHKKELPSVAEIIRISQECINEWNNSKHPRYDKSRLEVYNESVNPEPQPVTQYDMIDLFYETTGEITYMPTGITLGRHKRIYEVVKNGKPDLTLIRDKFVVKYDSEDLSKVYLYKKVGDDLRYIDVAPEKDCIPEAVADYKEGDGTRIKEKMQVRKEQLQLVTDTLADIRDNAGWSADDVLRAGALAPKNLSTKAQSIYLSDEDDEIKIVND